MKVNTLIEKANALWDERNVEAVKRGEAELPRMLPLIRLKVFFFFFDRLIQSLFSALFWLSV